MNLYLIHCGYYDLEIAGGVYEFHVNLPIAAANLEEAKRRVRAHPLYSARKMHIDGIQEIRNVDGYDIRLQKCANSATDICTTLDRDL